MYDITTIIYGRGTGAMHPFSRRPPERKFSGDQKSKEQRANAIETVARGGYSCDRAIAAVAYFVRTLRLYVTALKGAAKRKGTAVQLSAIQQGVETKQRPQVRVDFSGRPSGLEVGAAAS